MTTFLSKYRKCFIGELWFKWMCPIRLNLSPHTPTLYMPQLGDVRDFHSYADETQHSMISWWPQTTLMPSFYWQRISITSFRAELAIGTNIQREKLTVHLQTRAIKRSDQVRNLWIISHLHSSFPKQISNPFSIWRTLPGSPFLSLGQS